MPTTQLRCIADALNIRTSPRVLSDNKTGEQVKFNDVITVELDSRTEADGAVWLRHDRGWSQQRTLDNRGIYLTDSLGPRERMFGINIDPNNPRANPPAERLYGVGWVRFVFHVDSRREPLERSFAFYDPLIRAYAQTGTKILLILLQDTYWGNGPWTPGSDGDWRKYARMFGERAGQIARRYRGLVSAYQIWNEGDVSGEPTSIFITPENYALILLAASQAIAQADPAAQLLTMGLASGTDRGADYLLRVRAALGGVMPVDGICIHPYGQIPSLPDAEPFPEFSRGLLKRTLIKFADTFPGYAIWITEFGVPRVNVNDQSLWPHIARYMDKSIDYVRAQFNHVLIALIWFAWGDDQDHAGIVNLEQKPKGVLYSEFFRNVLQDFPAILRQPTPYDGRPMVAYLDGSTVQENTIAEIGSAIRNGAPNVGSVLLRTSVGTQWAGRSDPKRALAINAPADLGRWTAELAGERLRIHAWHQVRAASVVEITNEILLITQVALSSGVGSVILDLDSGFGPRTSTAIRNFMVPMRRNLPQPYHIALSFDGKPETFQNITFSEWFPFINSWHPRVLIPQTGAAAQNPLQYLNAVCNFLKPFRKPIIPMLILEQTEGKPIPQEQVRQVTRAAFELHGCQSVSFWRLGSIGAADFAAIRSIDMPLMAGYVVRPPLGTLTVRPVAGVRVRTVPSTTGDILEVLPQNAQIISLEKRIIGGFEWVRHEKGWSASRNTTTSEIFLS